MIEKTILSRKKKRERIKICTLSDFKEALNKEGYKINKLDEEQFKKQIEDIFKINNIIIEKLYEAVELGDIVYKVNDTKDFIDYIEKIIIFENENDKLWKKIKNINELKIDRVEYEREPSTQDDVENILNNINKIAPKITSIMEAKDISKLEKIEDEIDEEYLYAKDIELLKKMISPKKQYLRDEYDEETKTKTIVLKIPDEITYEYISSEKGSVEYHKYLTSNIQRIQRLNKSIDKYIKIDEQNINRFIINQSEAIQDSINIAVCVYQGNEYRAISGKNDIRDCCKSPMKGKAVFESSKVNKLGKLGIGYNRINDSEKKILEEINKLIQNKSLKDEGKLILYSKWEPCPSCYSVIYQFCKKHPNIKIEVKYIKRYGE